MIHPSHFELGWDLIFKLVQELLDGQQNALLQSRLVTAFHVLLNSNHVSSSLDRNNRRRKGVIIGDRRPVTCCTVILTLRIL
ncbi:unnamed protein product [Calypogeia fissa]